LDWKKNQYLTLLSYEPYWDHTEGILSKKTGDNQTVLQLAEKNNKNETVLFLKKFEADRLNMATYAKNGVWPKLIEVLKEHPSWIDYRNPLSNSGFRPIHQVAWWGNIAMAKKIIEMGADVYAKTTKGETAYDIARSRGHKEVADYFLSKMERYCKEPPEEYICPISKEIMTDPVILCDGFTFEKHVIAKWLADNNTSPLTNLPLTSKALIPNIALRKAIETWKNENLVQAKC